MNDQYRYPTVSDVIEAWNNNLLTTAEAKLILCDYFSALKKLDEARQIVAARSRRCRDPRHP